MSMFAAGEWASILGRLNSFALKKDRWRIDLTPEALATGWCGRSPAGEREILEAEDRLGLKLPPSYRSFLSISNGWRPFSSFIERLLPVQEVKPFRAAEPRECAMICGLYEGEDAHDNVYLDYDVPEHNVAMRVRYYPDCLLIGRAWDGGGGELLLLNPQVASSNGEWETIFFGNWLPGNERYRSFRDFVEYSVDTQEQL